MKPTSRLALPGYLVALFLVAAPLMDTLLLVLPLDVAEPQWRFGAFGLLSRALGVPFLGLLLAAAVAVAFGNRKTLRAMAVVVGAAALVLLASTGLFALDALQVRAPIRPELKRGFDTLLVASSAKLFLGFVLTAVMARGAWVAGRPGRASAGGDRKSEVVVGG